jgi:hypothetical protein
LAFLFRQSSTTWHAPWRISTLRWGRNDRRYQRHTVAGSAAPGSC